MECQWRGQMTYTTKNPFQCHSVYHKSHKECPRIESGSSALKCRWLDTWLTVRRLKQIYALFKRLRHLHVFNSSIMAVTLLLLHLRLSSRCNRELLSSELLLSQMFYWEFWPLTMGAISSPETPKLCCVTTQKGEEINFDSSLYLSCISDNPFVYRGRQL